MVKFRLACLVCVPLVLWDGGFGVFVANGWLFSSSDDDVPAARDEGDLGSSVKGVARKNENAYTGLRFSCDGGKGDFSIDVVNDNYCDCKDGSDEPGTAACSGIAADGGFFCVNENYKGIYIPSSRVSDGICDCCDGTDEVEGTCSNNCLEVGKKYREEMRQFEKDRTEGLERKKDYIRRGQLVASKNFEELQASKNAEIESAEAEETKLNEEIRILEEEEERQRKEKEKVLRGKRIQSLHLEKLDAHELRVLIVDLVVDGGSKHSLENILNRVLKEKAENSTVVVEVNVDGSINEKTDADTPAPDEPLIATWVESDTVDMDDDGEEVEDEDAEKEDADEEDEDEGKPKEEKTKQEKEESELEKKRSTRRGISDKLRTLKSERDDLEKEAKLDFGPEKEWWALKGQCFSIDTGGYKYEMCPFGKAKQDHISLGSWSGFEEGSDYKVFKFTNGQRCWNGPERSLTVKGSCGVEEIILDVSEPSTCEYHMQFKTPALCK